MPPAAPPTFSPTSKQWEAIKAIRSRQYRYIMTGGAMSTAKSYGLASIFLSMAQQWPGTRYGVFRKHGTVINRTIWQTFIKTARQMAIEPGADYKALKHPDKMWELANDSQIWFMGLDETKDPDFNDVKGLELTAAGIDEANEVTREAADIVASRVGRENHPRASDGVVPPAFVLLTCNPSDNWVKDDYYTPWVKGEQLPKHLFIPSLPEDNPYNSQEYLDSLHAMPFQFRKRYVEGNWDYVDDANALFPNRVIDKAMISSLKPGKRSIGADIAREGSDKTVFALVENGVLIDLYEPDITITDETPVLNQVAEMLVVYMKVNKVGYEDTTVDAVGLGAGVVDNCRKMGYFVRSYKSGEKATELMPDGMPKYDNRRSQSYWQLSQAMQSGDFQIYRDIPNLEELRKDLLAHTYEVTDKQFIVESKGKMKKRLRRSPDYADAVVMAFRNKTSDNANDIISVGAYDTWFKEEED